MFKLLILLIVFLTVVVPFIFRLIGAMTEPERLKAWEGKRVRKKLEAQFGEFKPDPRMQKIGHRLGVAGGVHGNFYKVPGKMVNAAALPNGDIIVWQGLLNMVGKNDAQLASVLAHELGHLKHEHYIQRIYWSALMQFAFGLIARPLVGYWGRELGSKLLLSGYSRFHERQADDTGFDMMGKAGFDQVEMIRFFERLPSNNSAMGFLGTHPEPKARAQRLRERLQPKSSEKKGSIEQSPKREKSSNVLQFPNPKNKG